MIKLKRIYDPPAEDDGERILVDRIWPRGMSKARAAIDQWVKDLAPSTELRHWFGHDPERWDEFQRRYALELASQGDRVDAFRQTIAHKTVTLLFAAKDAEHNNAVALAGYLVAPRRAARR